MSTTIWGCASTIGGIAAETDQFDEIIGGHAYEELELGLPDGGLTVDLDHQPDTEVGEVVYGEVAEDGRVNIVAVVDGVDLDAAEQPVYYSPELTMIGGSTGNGETSYIARTAELRSVALTFSPLTLGARPIEWLAGDIRNAGDRGYWAGIWRMPLLHRAVEHVSASRLETRAKKLVDLRPRDEPPWQRSVDQYVPLDERRPVGAWRHGPPGRILSVR